MPAPSVASLPVAPLAALGPFRDLGSWARDDGLEIVMLVSGAVLLVRAAHFGLARYAEGVGARPAWLVGPLGVPQADHRRRQALIRAMGWLFTAVTTIVVGGLIATRLGVPLTTIVPPATIAGVAVGFGAQRVVQDVLSGFFLLSERQINVGDVIRVSPPGTTTGVSGTVEEVTMRVTRVRTVKGEVVFIPNGEIRQLTNLSVEWARLVVDVPLRAVDDVAAAIERLRQVGEEMAADPAWRDVLLEGPEVLGVEDLELDTVRVRVVARVRPTDQWRTGRELRLRITSGLAEAGISTVLPVPEPEGTP